MRLCVENIGLGSGNSMRSYNDIVDLIQSVESPCVGVALDTGHAEQHGGGLERPFEVFRPHLLHVHVHDWIGVGPDEDHREVGVAGGQLNLRPYAEIIGEKPLMLIMEIGRSAVISAEHGEDPKIMVLRSRRALTDMLGDIAK